MSETVDLTQPGNWVPEDTFGARLALVRQHMNWNVAEAARACGFNDETWRQWEKKGHTPRGVYEVARKISRVTGCSYDWLVLGGDLTRSRWTSPTALRLIPGDLRTPSQMNQMALPLFTQIAEN